MYICFDYSVMTPVACDTVAGSDFCYSSHTSQNCPKVQDSIVNMCTRKARANRTNSISQRCVSSTKPLAF